MFKKYIILMALLLVLLIPPAFTYAEVSRGEISFSLVPNTSYSIYSFSDVDVGETSVGYAAINIGFPSELEMNYMGKLLSSSNKPTNWIVTVSGAGDITNVVIVISNPSKSGTASDIEVFLNSSTFTLKSPDIYPPIGAPVIIMISEQTIVQYTDETGGMHVYEFVNFSTQPDKKTLTWLEAYNAARSREFSGAKGHLATLTSIDEQIFVYSSIAQQSGWLGGTRLRFTNGDIIDGTKDISTSLSSYTSDRSIADRWYWADGPEAGTVFYNRPVRDDSAGPIPDVFNFFSNRWTYNTYPMFQAFIQNGNEPNGDSGECCLQFAWSEKASWNDLLNNSSSVKGYYVEYDFPDGLLSSSGISTVTLEVPLAVSFVINNDKYIYEIPLQTVWPNSTITEPLSPKAGYIYPDYGNRAFLGWYSSLSDTEAFDFSTTLTASNVGKNPKLLYGRWEQYYNVSLDINNHMYGENIPSQTIREGGNVVSPLQLEIGKVYDNLNGQNIGNMEFLGWFPPGENSLESSPIVLADYIVKSDITFHAEWKQHYSVTYDVNNLSYCGSPIIEKKNYPSHSVITPPSELTSGMLYSNYGNKRFLGWFNEDVLYNFSEPLLSNLSLTAHWEQYYTVSFVNTKNNGVPKQLVAENSTVTAPDSSSWNIPGLSFYGWTLDINESNYLNFTPYDFGTPISSDLVLYGVWDPAIFSLIFDPNGGNWNGDSSFITHEYCPMADSPPWDNYLPSHIPPNPTKHGYTFLGWFTKDGISPSSEEEVIMTNTVYFARFVPTEYFIHYELNGGLSTVTNPSSYTVENTNFPISIGQPERRGYTFMGWLVEYENGVFNSSVPITDFSVIEGSFGDIYLYACWNTGNEYGIYYILNGGAGSIYNPSCYTVNDNIEIINPIKTGYTFLGWKATGGIVINGLTTELIVPYDTLGDLYLEAFWSDANIYTISYSLFGGTNPIENPKTYTVNDNFEIYEATKEGYIFLGWTVAGSYSSVVPSLTLSIPTGSIGDISLTAHWSNLPKESPNPEPNLPPISNIKERIPKTGDNTNLLLWYLLFISSGVLFIVTVIIWFRKEIYDYICIIFLQVVCIYSKYMEKRIKLHNYVYRPTYGYNNFREMLSSFRRRDF